MEMTATASELSKSDFFDFVTSNEITDAQYKEQMRSVNVFMESPDSRSNPLLSDEPKEQNNNSLVSATGPRLSSTVMTTAGPTTTTLQSFDSIWNVDRERDRLETAMLEDLNKYYWSQDSDINTTSSACAEPTTSNKLISNNTDGQIYTLTVLNQDVAESNTNRYWCPKEEDVSISSPTEMEQNSSLDLETILNIMPNQINGFANDFNQDSLNVGLLPKTESFTYDEGENEQTNSDLNSASIIKVEPYAFDENQFSSNDKDDLHSSAVGTQIIETQIEFNNNNNDWKLTDQNAESHESLLRSALQGKAFIRYSALQKSNAAKLEGVGELKRVIISDNNNKLEVPSHYGDRKLLGDELVMSVGQPNGNVNIVLFEDPSSVVDSENPTSTQSVDDILLSQLDTNYPEDYEKLKRIASELGESVSVQHQYCTVDGLETGTNPGSLAARGLYNIHNVNGELVTMIPAGEVQLPQAHLQIVTASPTVSSTKTLGKKYKRVHKSSPPGSTIIQGSTASMQPGTAVQPATSTSNGVRKERSLHYCSICSKGFKDKYSVNVHVRTHTGEKPFSCSLCGKSFRQKAHLAKHYQTHIAQKTAATNGTVKSSKQR